MNIGILLAAGSSKRFGSSDKLFAPIFGKPIIFHALKLLEDSPKVDAIIITVNPQNRKKIMEVVQNEKFKKVKKIIIGDKTRFESMKKAIRKSSSAAFFVLHNAANPFATQEELLACFRFFTKGISGVAVGRPVTATLKRVTGHGMVEETVERLSLWETETPQVVRAPDFLDALKKCPKQKHHYTDDLAVLEAAGKKTAVVEASPQNRKITFEGDLPHILVGIGEDSHPFSKSLPSKSCLIIGGVKIKNLPPLAAESDGDVMLHALCNAIRSAMGLGSLGTFATTMREKGVRDSGQYLKRILASMQRQHRAIQQCSFSFEAKRPKIDPLVPLFKKNLSALLKISPQHIGITATSGENLTPFGRGKGIKCQAIVVLAKI